MTRLYKISKPTQQPETKCPILRPEFEEESYSGSIAGDAGTQEVVLKVEATDRDSGDNGDVVYSLQGNNLPFAIRVSYRVSLPFLWLLF